jgi:hypothetical protein
VQLCCCCCFCCCHCCCSSAKKAATCSPSTTGFGHCPKTVTLTLFVRQWRPSATAQPCVPCCVDSRGTPQTAPRTRVRT